MAVEGGMKCVKFLVFFFNFIFWLCGLAVIVVGILVQLEMHKTIVMTNVSGSATPIVLIVVGVIIFFISFFGCCGAAKENYCMVTMFAILLSLIIIIEVGIIIAGYVFKGKLGGFVDEGLKDMVNQYNQSEKIREAMDDMQKELKCCGINSTSDWRDFGTDQKSVPDSCCKNVSTDCGKGSMHDSAKVYQEGCEKAVVDLLQKNVKWVIVGALVIAVVQILGIVFACVLMKGIRSGYEVM
ncbi:CD63 antigen-like [Scleropages formosus]|uniref:Tetraspanin n=1 Tax=Scleropages formosus TaxID=113540 RepID=A0A0N8JYH6_SCLFO|nr:CD63 antigen [Scleropages formosus]KPP66561.1 CD63 antigen-like [Scleropages formosus]